MNAAKHATTGVATGVVTAPLAAVTGLPGLVWVAVVVAGSIWPDGDHPQASIARMWGPVSGAVVGVVSPLVGGHRGLTHHPILGAVGAAVVLVVASLHPVTAAAGWAVLAGVFLAAAGSVIRRVPWLVNGALSAGVGVSAYATATPLAPAAPALALGVVVHLIGDRWPDKSRRARAAVALSYLAVTVVTVWHMYPHLEGSNT